MSEIYFHNKDFESRLSLKEGLRGTRKWPIHSDEGLKLETSPSGISIRLYFHSCSQSSRYPCTAEREMRESLSFPLPLDKDIEDSGNEICSTPPTTRRPSLLESLKLSWDVQISDLCRALSRSHPSFRSSNDPENWNISWKRHTSTSQHSSVGTSLLRSWDLRLRSNTSNVPDF